MGSTQIFFLTVTLYESPINDEQPFVVAVNPAKVGSFNTPLHVRGSDPHRSVKAESSELVVKREPCVDLAVVSSPSVLHVVGSQISGVTVKQEPSHIPEATDACKDEASVVSETSVKSDSDSEAAESIDLKSHILVPSEEGICSATVLMERPLPEQVALNNALLKKCPLTEDKEQETGISLGDQGSLLESEHLIAPPTEDVNPELSIKDRTDLEEIRDCVEVFESLETSRLNSDPETGDADGPSNSTLPECFSEELSVQEHIVVVSENSDGQDLAGNSFYPSHLSSTEPTGEIRIPKQCFTMIYLEEYYYL